MYFYLMFISCLDKRSGKIEYTKTKSVLYASTLNNRKSDKGLISAAADTGSSPVPATKLKPHRNMVFFLV